jgi:dTDP-4-dehydrorhamnose reductase
VARVYEEALVIRTSFRPREWPYPVAFTDVYTGQDYVDVIAPEVALAVYNSRKIPHEILHIVTERKSVYELARRRSSAVRSSTKREAAVNLPEDVSLDARRWQAFKASLS